jgi:hypothetical protein
VGVRHQQLTHAVKEKLRLLQSHGILLKKYYLQRLKNQTVFNGSWIRIRLRVKTQIRNKVYRRMRISIKVKFQEPKANRATEARY